MIVKILNNDKGDWSFFECAIIHTQHTLMKDVINPGEYVNLLESNFNRSVTILRLETKESHFRKILTDRVCYILNNQGKTIDRI